MPKAKKQKNTLQSIGAEELALIRVRIEDWRYFGLLLRYKGLVYVWYGVGRQRQDNNIGKLEKQNIVDSAINMLMNSGDWYPTKRLEDLLESTDVCPPLSEEVREEIKASLALRGL